LALLEDSAPEDPFPEDIEELDGWSPLCDIVWIETGSPLAVHAQNTSTEAMQASLQHIFRIPENEF
jgi:hypothetical protein